MAIKIVTDSTCDLTKEIIEQYDISVAPLTIHFEDGEFLDGVTITQDEFYRRLETAQALPKTAAPPPDVFEKIFKRLIDNGDEVICINASSGISSTYQSAMIAKDKIGSEKIMVVDSKTISLALGLLVTEAAKLAQQGGKIMEEIASIVNTLKQKVRIFALVDSFKNLAMGGRVSKAVSMVGGALNIKVLAEVKDGVVSLAAKTFGMKRLIIMTAGEIKKSGIDLTKAVCFGHIDALKQLGEFMDILRSTFDIGDCPISTVGSSVGTHCGKGALGLAYFVP